MTITHCHMISFPRQPWDNLDHYGIDCDNIAAGVQKMAAASASGECCVAVVTTTPKEACVFVYCEPSEIKGCFYDCYCQWPLVYS